MKLFNRFNTIFYKLVISYIVLTIILTVMLGAVSYLYFSRIFNSEVEKVHQNRLEHLRSTLDTSVLQAVKKIYLDLCTERSESEDLRYLFDHNVSDNHAKLSNVYQFINKVHIANADIIDAIHVYYLNNKLIVSSSWGIKYLEETGRKSYRDTNWIEKLYENEISTLWIGTRQLPVAFESDAAVTNVFSFVRSYPYSAKGNSIKGVVAIDIKESALSDVIYKLFSDEYDSTFIIDNNGLVITHSNKKLLYTS